MKKLAKQMAICIAAFTMNATAQTAVTTSTPTSAGTVPLFQTASTVANSVITQSSGNVVIGSSSVGSNLSIQGGSLGSTSGSALNLLTLYNYDVANINSLHISQIRTSAGTNWETATTRIQNIVDYTPQAYIDFNPAGGLYTMAFGSSSNQYNTSGGEFMRILANGNVGIGTTSPAAKLDVNGSINISGSGAGITFPNGGGTQSVAWTGILCGGDYAEAVDVSGERTNYHPGDVLVIGATSGSDVAKSSEPYSTLVLGVYATKPGVVGRRQTADAKTSTTEVPMAMVGIVPTKVSAENGPIRRGDLLVTSSTVGYAMKGTDRSRMLGAVVGKALGNLNSGTGVIEVAITLQ